MESVNDTKIAVVGLGYVGLPLAVEFGKKLDVVGYDINPRRIADVEIITESLMIDPSSFPPVELPQPTRAQPPRAANDPRLGRAIAGGQTQGNAALERSTQGEEATEEAQG